MAPIDNSSDQKPLPIVIAIISSIVLMIILPLVITAIWVICSDIQYFMLSDRPRYLKQLKLRKEWNKAALAEQKRQQVAKDTIVAMIKRERQSDEKLVLLFELTERVYFPARRYIYHPLIDIVFRGRLWERIKYKLLNEAIFGLVGIFIQPNLMKQWQGREEKLMSVLQSIPEPFIRLLHRIQQQIIE